MPSSGSTQARADLAVVDGVEVAEHVAEVVHEAGDLELAVVGRELLELVGALERVGEDVDRVAELAERVEHAVARREALEDLVDRGRGGGRPRGTRYRRRCVPWAGVTDAPTLDAARDRRPGVGVAPARRRVGGVERRGDRRRRRPHGRRHAHGALAVGAVRGRGEGARARPVKRVVLTHAHIDHVGGTSAFRNAMVLGSRDDVRAARPGDAGRRVQELHARVHRGVRRARGAGHPSRLAPRDRRRAADEPHRGAAGARPHRRRPDGARRRLPTCCSPATCASSA